ncbi:MAG: DNA alkylation repair protein [Bacteroidales bacterium]|jgi:3-methyladenine DNA glycosylase AlkD|nr:DNA alkylation repair protein [Bacteroidales bacterium]
MKNILDKIRIELQNSIDEKTQNSNQNFFKEKIKFYGVKVPVVHNISKNVFNQIDKFSKKEIFHICEELWKSGYIEESFIACDLSYYIRKDYEPCDFTVFESWLEKYVNNWASCDTLCNHTIGEFIEMYPDYSKIVANWALSKNRWVKRGAAVTFIIPARKGLFLDDIFKIADILLIDTDDLVQKGYGWMLKAASEKYQIEVFNYVMSKKDVMPRTALRYAIEKMPQELRIEAMKK